MTLRDATCRVLQLPFVLLLAAQLFVTLKVRADGDKTAFTALTALTALACIAIIEWRRRRPPPPAVVQPWRFVLFNALWLPFAVPAVGMIYFLFIQVETLLFLAPTTWWLDLPLLLYVIFVARLFELLRLFWARPLAAADSAQSGDNPWFAWEQAGLRPVAVAAGIAAVMAAAALYGFERVVIRPAGCTPDPTHALVIAALLSAGLAVPAVAVWRSLPAHSAALYAQYRAWLATPVVARRVAPDAAPGVPFRRRLAVVYGVHGLLMLLLMFAVDDLASVVLGCASASGRRADLTHELWLLSSMIASWPVLHVAAHAQVSRMR